MRGRVLVVAAAALAIAALRPSAALAYERLDGFDAVATVQSNGDLDVTETITWDFDGTPKKHGIFRFLPRLHRWTLDRQPGWEDWQEFDRVTPITFQEVSSPTGANVDRHTERKGDNEVLRLGNKNVLVSGRQQYRLHYTIGRAVVKDQLRYAITGTGWLVPTGTIRARITAPVAADADVQCVRTNGDPSPGCTVSVDGDTVTLTATDLATEIVIPLDPARVESPAPVFEEHQTLRRAFDWTHGQPVAAGGIAAGMLAVVALVARRGRDRLYASGGALGGRGDAERRRSLTERLASPVEFAPPEDVPPGMVGAIRDGKVDHVALSSTLVDLAVRGHVRIEQITGEHKRDSDHELLAVPPGSGKGTLRSYEQTLLNALLGGAPSVTLKSLKADKTLYKPLGRVKESILDDVVRAGYWAKRPDRVKGKWIGLGVVVVVAGILLTVALASATDKALLGPPFILLGLGLMVIAPIMPVRTAAGSRLRARLAGFEKLFDAGEGERIAFTEKQDVFSQYLPYAMAFGNVDRWVKRFADVGQIPDTSSWYGTSYGTAAAFDAKHFSSAIEGFEKSLSSAMNAASQAPSSSGSGGGGGSSSGGGGGGSW